MTDQTPEARLAAAWTEHIDYQQSIRLEIDDEPPHACSSRCVTDILAADPTLAADLALAAAVRRLGDDWWLDQVTRKDGSTRFVAHIYPSGRHGTGPTLVAAIEDALAAKEAERE